MSDYLSIKKLSCWISVCILLFFASCKKDDVQDLRVDPIELIASRTNLTPDKETKSVHTTITIKGFESVDFMMVTKSAGDPYVKKIDRQDLSPTYEFTYSVQRRDPEQFDLILTAYRENGTTSRDLILKVDNRQGFFIKSVQRIARVTGLPFGTESFLSPNNTVKDWDVGGTDLGIIWEMTPGQYGIFFGDTFGGDFSPNPSAPGPNGGNWRSNVLAFSGDQNLDDGITFSSMATDQSGKAREIVYSAKSGSDVTSIPTAAIRANGVDYVHYFNMRDWDTWTTNYSGLYKSTDNGQTWVESDKISFSSNSKFGQAGYFKKDGYVYMIGTRTGRDSPAHVARFKEADMENKDNYEFWDSGVEQWIKGNEDRATVIISDKVGELSFIYNNKYNKWIIAYFNGDRYNISLRTASDITGPWSQPYEVVSGWEYAQLYGSYFHPLSVDGDDLYFLMSMWMPYNVFLMKATIAEYGG